MTSKPSLLHSRRFFYRRSVRQVLIFLLEEILEGGEEKKRMAKMRSRSFNLGYFWDFFVKNHNQQWLPFLGVYGLCSFCSPPSRLLPTRTTSFRLRWEISKPVRFWCVGGSFDRSWQSAFWPLWDVVLFAFFFFVYYIWYPARTQHRHRQHLLLCDLLLRVIILPIFLIDMCCELLM